MGVFVENLEIKGSVRRKLININGSVHRAFPARKQFSSSIASLDNAFSETLQIE